MGQNGNIKKELLVLGIFSALVLLLYLPTLRQKIPTSPAKNDAATSDQQKGVLYTGKIYHIFFHSLVIYPELGFLNDDRGRQFRKYMVTKDEFEKILPLLYENNFVLIDIKSIYKVNPDGTVTKKDLYLPPGKKPLIISLDDLSYYRFDQGFGFAHKLVLDQNGNVATEIITPEGKDEITRDGDVVPILDDFIKLHSDFSQNGVKGVIALTGFDGVLGYRTEFWSSHRDSEIAAAKIIIEKLKATGWQFANHSYAHDQPFREGSISLEGLKRDIDLWNNEVRPLVGPTDIYIGPFGQVFKPDDPRRQYIISQGYKFVAGVGMDLYLNYFPNYVMMDRADIDGYRLLATPFFLKDYFDPQKVLSSR